MLDVAQRAGVSRTTASFVLTGRQDMRISPATEQRVLQAARELNYRPSMLARGLGTNNTSTIGLLLARITSDTITGDVIRGALTTALLHDHLLFIGETGGERRVETQLIHGMIDRGVTGFLIVSMYTQRVRIPAELRTHPAVLVNCIGRAPGVPMVVPDELEAGRNAVRILLGHGHRDRIVLVGETAPQVIAAAERRAGIDQALGANGLRLAGTIPTAWWPETSHQAVRDYLIAGHRPSALICLNDRVAMGAYQAAQDLGLSIPSDLSVVSFDDSDLAGWLQPGLTSIAIPHLELGRRAVELLLDPHRTGGLHRAPMTLRERGSITAPHPSGHRTT